MGAKVVTVHAGTYPVFEERARALDRLIHNFSSFAKLRTPVVSLENMPVKKGTNRECLGPLNDLRELHQLFPDVRFTLDIGHALQNGDDFESFLREKVEYIEDIHLHDGRLGGSAHLPLGRGELDLRRTLLTLQEVNFKKYIGLETISASDTLQSWSKWLNAEKQCGVLTTSATR